MHNDADDRLPERSGTFRAVVQAGSTITTYLRAGQGRPVVVVRRGDAADPAWDGVVATLQGSFRTIIPEWPAEATSLTPWLIPFLDGLGLGDVAVVADASLADEAGALVRGEPHRISRVVILAPEGSTQADPRCRRVATDRPVEAVVSEVAWFLAGAPDRLPPSGG